MNTVWAAPCWKCKDIYATDSMRDHRGYFLCRKCFTPEVVKELDKEIMKMKQVGRDSDY